MIIFGKLFINYLKTNKYKVIEQTYHLKNVILTFKMYNNKYPYHRFWIDLCIVNLQQNYLKVFYYLDSYLTTTDL